MVLLGTSKWFAKIIVKGWNLNGVTLCRIVLKLNTFVVNVVVGQLFLFRWKDADISYFIKKLNASLHDEILELTTVCHKNKASLLLVISCNRGNSARSSAYR